MPTPTETILEHLDAIANAVERHGITGAWYAMPPLHGAMSENTFRTTAPVVLATATVTCQLCNRS